MYMKSIPDSNGMQTSSSCCNKKRSTTLQPILDLIVDCGTKAIALVVLLSGLGIKRCAQFSIRTPGAHILLYPIARHITHLFAVNGCWSESCTSLFFIKLSHRRSSMITVSCCIIRLTSFIVSTYSRACLKPSISSTMVSVSEVLTHSS